MEIFKKTIDDEDDLDSSLIIELYNNSGQFKIRTKKNTPNHDSYSSINNRSDDESGALIELDNLTPVQESQIYFLENDIVIKKFYDYRPNDAIEYFSKPPKSNQSINPISSNGSEKDSDKNSDEYVDKKEGHAVVMPFFNEESHELQQTLNSLHNSHETLMLRSKKWKNKPLYVCLIQDGWHKASESMKIYLMNIFDGKINGVGWWNYFQELLSESAANSNATFIIERKNYAPTNINPQEFYSDKQKYMNITLLIKANNRRKHNSHEWFLARSGFAEASNAKYLFLTDAFTFYADNCLYYLTKDLDKNNKLSGVTGRQRVMTRAQQGTDVSVFSFGHILTHMQLFDFELANAVYNGAFSLGGLLPVIPGPCGLYRATDMLQNSVRDSYFNVVNEEPDKTGIVLGNLRIAEDRILTYYAVTKTKEEKYLAFNPLAVFYFEAETNLEKFILQRRRWINGSVAGYIYLLFQNFKDFQQWNAPLLRKIYIWLLLMSQFIIYCMVSIVPGVSLKTLYYGIEYFMGVFGIDSQLALVLIFLVLWAIYVAHVFVHHQKKFNYMIMYVLVLLSLATTIITYASLFYYSFIDQQKTLEEIFTTAHPVFYMAVTVLIGPFISALLLSGRGHSFMYMIKSFIPYMLFIPLLVGWFGSYAYARTWDLSWGNRPATELNDITVEQKNIMVTKFKEKSVRIILALILLNIGVFFIPLEGQLYLMAVFFVIAISQMFFSVIYCLTRIPYKCEMFRNYLKYREIKKANKKSNKKLKSSEKLSIQDASLIQQIGDLTPHTDSSPDNQQEPGYDLVITI